jgi:predicted restriction endonuclease
MYDLSLLPTRRNKKAAREFLKLVKNSRNKDSGKTSLLFMEMGFSHARLLNDAFDLVSEQELINDIDLFFEFIGKKQHLLLVSVALKRGMTEFALIALKTIRKLDPKLVSEIQNFSFTNLKDYYENYGFEAFIEFVKKCELENIRFVFPQEIFLFPSNVGKTKEELNSLAKKLIECGIAFNRKIEEDTYLPYSQAEINELDCDKEFLNRPHQILQRHIHILMRNNGKAFEIAKLLLESSALMKRFSLSILHYWSMQGIDINEYSALVKKAINDYSTAKNNEFVFLALLFIIRSHPREAEVLFAEYVDKFNSEIAEKMKGRRVNPHRYDAFNSYAWAITIFDAIHEDSDLLVSLFKVLKFGSVPSKFMCSTLLYYFTNNYIEKLSSSFLESYQEIEGPLSTVDWHYILKSISSYTDKSHWLEVVKGFEDKLDDRNWSQGVELGQRVNDIEFANNCLSQMKDTDLKDKALKSMEVNFAIYQGNVDKALLVIRKNFEEGKVVHPSVSKLIRYSKTSEYRKILDFVFQLKDSGLDLDTRMFKYFLVRLYRKKNYREIIEYVNLICESPSFENLELQLYKLYALLMIGEKEEFDILLSQVTKLSLDSDLKEIVEQFKGVVLETNFRNQLDSLFFDFNESEVVVYQKTKIVREGIQRDRSLVMELKEMYENKCQVCNLAISTPFGSLSEAAHIQGIGSPHFGPDVIGNLLILCPNHHTAFDNAGWYVQDNLEIIETESNSVIGKLIVLPEHEIVHSCFVYQRNYALKAKSLGKRNWKSLRYSDIA